MSHLAMHTVSAWLVLQAQRAESEPHPYEGRESCSNCAHRQPSPSMKNCNVCGSLSRWQPRETMGRS